MTESRAWLLQAKSDYRCAETILEHADASAYCHAIAKFQQTQEKAVKSLVAALRDAGLIHADVGFGHGVSRFMRVLTRLPRSQDHRSIQNRIHSLLDPGTRGEILALDALAPKRPAPGALPARNTEYPFQTRPGAEWRAPAEADCFSRGEVDRFRRLGRRVIDGCGRLLPAIERLRPLR